MRLHAARPCGALVQCNDAFIVCWTHPTWLNLCSLSIKKRVAAKNLGLRFKHTLWRLHALSYTMFLGAAHHNMNRRNHCTANCHGLLHVFTMLVYIMADSLQQRGPQGSRQPK